MDFRVILSGIIGLVPALLLLWFTLRRYDKPYVDMTLFDDRKVFIAFAAGIVFGIAAAVVYSLVMRPVDVLSAFFLAALLFVFEEMFKFVFLNFKSFLQKPDTPFYGVSLGLGIASSFVLLNVYLQVIQEVTVIIFALLVIYSVMMSLLHCSTGALIGYGSSRGTPWTYLAEAMIIRFFMAIALLPVLMARIFPTETWFYWLYAASIVATLVISAVVYYHVYTSVLPRVLPEVARRRQRLKSRKVRKGKA